jgi:SAM-dependent methyltransferase
MGVDPDGKHVKPIELLEGQREEYSEYAKTITALLPENGAIMDVGAATGLMLSLIDDPRAKVAVEPNAFPATVAMREGHMVIQDWAEALSPPPKPLACIIMNKTLDHLPRPDQFLAKAVNWLAPGGLLLLGGLINPSCLTARIYGPDFRLFHPFHQVYPTPAAVDKVLTPYGLELVTTWRPYFQTPHGSPVKFLKTCGFIALRCLKLSPVSISKAFPGNTVTYLYRKRILFRPLKVETPVTSSLSA